MVQKSKEAAKTSGKRGRPRAYDPDAALERARDAFWDAGFAATSLDELSAATGMNRPSLYSAFGDKRALYLKAFASYMAAARAALAEVLAADLPVREALRRLYIGALAMYLSGSQGPRGCFMIGTATTEAVQDPKIRSALQAALAEIDAAFEARLRLAQRLGEIAAEADPAALAKLASALLHSLAIRARAGDSRASLEALIASGIDLICGSAARSIEDASRL